MKSSTDKEALLLLTHLIEFVYRLLWGDLFTLPVGGVFAPEYADMASFNFFVL